MNWLKRISAKNMLSIVLILMSIALVIVETKIGETILGNAIFLGSALVATAIAFMLLTYDFHKKPTQLTVVLLCVGVIIILYILFMFLSGNVPAGYGP